MSLHRYRSVVCELIHASFTEESVVSTCQLVLAAWKILPAIELQG